MPDFDMDKLKRITEAVLPAVQILYPDFKGDGTDDATMLGDLIADVMIHMSFLADEAHVDANSATFQAEERTLKLLAFIGLDTIDPSSFEDCAYVGAALSCFVEDEDDRNEMLASSQNNWQGEIEGDDLTTPLDVDMFR